MTEEKAHSAGEGEKVRRYFDAEADRFDAIYRQDKGLAAKLIDGLFRGVIHRRFELTFSLCGPPEEKRVLDIGCGSGRYAVEFARRGALAHGLDFAPAMVRMSDEAAAAAGVADRCVFEQADFMNWDAPQPFDIALGMGFFDYIDEPQAFLARIRSQMAAGGQGVFSFPKRWNLRAPTRWLRLNLNHCPVHFYGRAQVEDLVRRAGWERADIHSLSRDFIVHAHAG